MLIAPNVAGDLIESEGEEHVWWAAGSGGPAMESLEKFIQGYRKKLGSHDTKPWELAMEASVHREKCFSENTRRPTKLKLELIDVDLVRGSTFPKEKSQLPWTFFSREAFLRVVLLPLRSQWWILQTSSQSLYYLLRVLYFLQIFSLFTWISYLYSPPDPQEPNGTDWLSGCDTLTPLILIFTVAEILTQAERHDQQIPSQHYESISDDMSVDYDDMASLSDRSCRSSSVGGNFGEHGRKPPRVLGKVKRKSKRRVSKAVTFVEEVTRWQAKSDDVFRTEEDGDFEGGDVVVAAKESKGFGGMCKGEETTDSGMMVVTDEEKKGGVVERGEDDDMESDVSDVELSRVSKAVLDESTSDKEATDEEAVPIPKRLLPSSSTSADHNPSPTFSISDEDEPPEPLVYPSASSQVIGCTLWEARSAHKVDLSVYEITNSIVQQVESSPIVARSQLVLIVFPVLFALLPACHSLFRAVFLTNERRLGWELMGNYGRNLSMSEWCLIVVKVNGVVQRYVWGFWFFLFLAVAFETYQQRYLIAKYFGYLTSSRRAKRAGLPHFRLSKVRNIKSWLCIRSCLKKYGPRKSVDVVVSFSCMSCLICVIFTCFMVVNAEDQFTVSIYVWESMLWLLAVGSFLLRFMVLGSKTNQKFRNLSILTTEQMNLYLRMEQRPHKKDQLMLVNNVLKLAADLIKEIEHPCRISGFPANPFLYNISRLLMLSAFSTLISEICGFKLKLHKLKM